MKIASVIKNRRVSENLRKWIDSYFQDQFVHPESRKEVTQSLKEAGFSQGVPRNKTGLALKIAHAALGKKIPVTAEARVAAVVNATSACPRCGSAMVDIGLANGVAGRYCSNVKCRVSCWVDK